MVIESWSQAVCLAPPLHQQYVCVIPVIEFNQAGNMQQQAY